MKIFYSIILLLSFRCSFAQLLEFQTRSNNKINSELPKVKAKKLDLIQEFKKSSDYELRRTRIDSLSFSNRIAILDSSNKAHFEKYASHKSIFLDLSPETIHRKDSLASLLVLNYYVLKDSLLSINKNWKEVLVNFEELAKSKNIGDSTKAKNLIYGGFLKIQDLLSYAEDKLVSKSTDFHKSIDALINNDNEQNRLVAFLPEINTFFGKAGFFAPSINLLGNQTVKGKAFEGSIKLFSTSLPNNEKIDWRTLAVAQTSEFGIIADFLGGFKKTENEFIKPRNIGIRFGSSYLLKRGLNEQSKKDTTYNFGMFHSHLGLEYVVVPKTLAFYADYNHQILGTNLTIISKQFPTLDMVKSQLGFYNTGVKFLINPVGLLSKNLKKFPIIIDLNFIWVSKKYAELDKIKNNRILGDRVIPNIKVALKM